MYDGQLDVAERAAVNGWRSVLAEMVGGSAAALGRFPIVMVILALAAVTANLSLLNHVNGIGWFTEDRIYPLGAAALAALATTLFAESRSFIRALRYVSPLLAATLAYMLTQWGHTFSTYHFAFVSALIAFVALAPFAGRLTALAFWLFSLRLGFALGLALVALLLLAGGLSAIIASLTYLFGVPISERIHAHVWVTVGYLIAPGFALGQIPARFEEPTAISVPDHLARGMRALGDYVAAPLLLTYAAILHAYALKIVLTGDIPQSQVGWLVLGFGISLFSALTVIHPFLNTGRAPTRLLVRSWPLLVPVPTVLLAYAAFLRIGSYGVTPERYMLVVFAATALLLALLQATRLKGDIRMMAGLPALALLFASFGPQGAIAVSVRSQVDRFVALVAEQPVPLSRNGEALSVLDFLNSRSALQRVSAVTLDPDEPAGLHYRQVALASGLDPDYRQLGDSDRFVQSLRPPNVIDVAQFDLVLPAVSLAPNSDPARRILPLGDVLSLSIADDRIVIVGEEAEAVFTLPREVLDTVIAGGPMEAPPLLLVSGEREIGIIATFVAGRLDQGPVIDRLNATFLLRARDW